jgi:hypothetical protein
MGPGAAAGDEQEDLTSACPGNADDYQTRPEQGKQLG